MKKYLLAFCCIAPLAFVGALKSHKTYDYSQSTVKISHRLGEGSGVNIGNGLILTANHVVADMYEVDIKNFIGWNGKGRVLWQSKTYDVALVEIDDKTQPSAEIDCSPLSIGTEIESIGNPAGKENVRMWGKISTDLRSFDPWKQAQLSQLPLVPGMSGGPIFNEMHQVVGINVGVMTVPISMMPTLTSVGVIVPAEAICRLMNK